MSNVLIPGGAGGGIYSEDVTAGAADVLKGRTTITSDSNDEIINGTMPDNRTRTSNGSVPGMSSHPSVATRPGYNLQIQPDTSGIRGIHIAPPPGYYDGQSYVNYPASELGDAQAAHVQQGVTYTSAAGLKLAGGMPVWHNPSTNAITVYNNESGVWDDAHLGRGRGIIARLYNGAKVDADWAFIPAPDMRPENIRQGKTIAGMAGTMVDYGAGRVVFRDATFDGTLVLGVARATYQYAIDNSAVIDPAKPFFATINNHAGSPYPPEQRTVFRHSLNLTPFRRMRIQYRCNGRESSGTGREAWVSMGVRFWRPGDKHQIAYRQYFRHTTYDQIGWNEYPWEWAEVDLSDVNEQVFVVHECQALHTGGDTYTMKADCDIAYIELIN